MPSRRQALAGAGLLGGGLLGGRLSTGTARAQAAGQVGTDTDPVDVKAWDLYVQNGATFNGSDLTGVGAMDVGSLVIGGTLYEEDDNSPINETDTTSFTYSVAGDYDEIIVIDQPDVVGHNQLQVNGDDGNNYDYLDNSDTTTTGEDRFSIPLGNQRTFLQITDYQQRVSISTPIQRSVSGLTVAGSNDNIGGSGINQFTLMEDTTRTTKARVYGRVMGI